MNHHQQLLHSHRNWAFMDVGEYTWPLTRKLIATAGKTLTLRSLRGLRSSAAPLWCPWKVFGRLLTVQIVSNGDFQAMGVPQNKIPSRNGLFFRKTSNVVETQEMIFWIEGWQNFTNNLLGLLFLGDGPKLGDGPALSSVVFARKPPWMRDLLLPPLIAKG